MADGDSRASEGAPERRRGRAAKIRRCCQEPSGLDPVIAPRGVGAMVPRPLRSLLIESSSYKIGL
jgi:hypothetical protein